VKSRRSHSFPILPGILVALFVLPILFSAPIVTGLARLAGLTPTRVELIPLTPQNVQHYLHVYPALSAGKLAGNTPYRTYAFTDHIYAMANHFYISAELGYGGYSYALLRARAFIPTDQETFHWYFDGQTLTWQIQSVANGLFLSTEKRNQGSSYAQLRARASPDHVFGYEQFYLYYDRATQEDVLQSAINHLFVSVELGYSGGNYALLRARTSETALSTWEQFLV